MPSGRDEEAVTPFQDQAGENIGGVGAGVDIDFIG